MNKFCRPGENPPLNLLPWLRHIPEWLPGGRWKAKSRALRGRIDMLYGEDIKACRKRLAENQGNGCFMEDVICNQERYGLDDATVPQLGATLIEAGAETTSSLLDHFIQCVATHPDVQRRAQEEIDAVIGPSRVPTFEDIEQLPYVRATIQEVTRFRPVAPIGIPHLATADEIVNGYFIPKGSTIIANFWGIYHDETIFEDPDVFNPDRFMLSEYGAKTGADPMGFRPDFNFGFGRRICPGRFLAINSININVMNLLWGFNFSPAKDPLTGKDIDIDVNDLHMGLVLEPSRFVCDIQPRGIAQAELIRARFAEARSVLKRFEGVSDEA